MFLHTDHLTTDNPELNQQLGWPIFAGMIVKAGPGALQIYCIEGKEPHRGFWARITRDGRLSLTLNSKKQTFEGLTFLFRNPKGNKDWRPVFGEEN